MLPDWGERQVDFDQIRHTTWCHVPTTRMCDHASTRLVPQTAPYKLVRNAWSHSKRFSAIYFLHDIRTFPSPSFLITTTAPRLGIWRRQVRRGAGSWAK